MTGSIKGVKKSVLSPECEKLLDDFEMYSVKTDGIGMKILPDGQLEFFESEGPELVPMVDILNVGGTHLTRVTCGISVDDLASMIAWSKRSFKEGQEAGRVENFRVTDALLTVATSRLPAASPIFADEYHLLFASKTNTHTVKTVNTKGLVELAKFLAENHKRGDIISTSPSMLRAWAEEAEFSLGKGNDAGIEIRSFESIHGRTQTYTISAEGLDSVEVENDE